jgi:HKD family nuclease
MYATQARNIEYINVMFRIKVKIYFSYRTIACQCIILSHVCVCENITLKVYNCKNTGLKKRNFVFTVKGQQNFDKNWWDATKMLRIAGLD